MELKEATEFIAFENRNLSPQLWLDLGCGSGLFTRALSFYLPAGSRIIAVDKDEKALRQIPGSLNNVVMERMAADFIQDPLNGKDVDGILMANSLHYVKDKEIFLNKLTLLLKANSLFLLVEYDRARANPWVPFPLTIDAARVLFRNAGYRSFDVLRKRPSVYGGRDMYAAIIRL